MNKVFFMELMRPLHKIKIPANLEISERIICRILKWQ